MEQMLIKNKTKRSRRFFNEGFKRTIVAQLETNKISADAVQNQYHIPKLLVARWCKQYRGAGSPTIESPNLENRINKLVSLLVERKLEELLNETTPAQFSA